MSEPPVIECRDLCRTFNEGALSVKVLTGVNLAVAAGERVAVVGASGSGKSTFLHLLGGLDTPSRGEVRVRGQLLSRLDQAERSRLRNETLGFIYQFHHLLVEFTALENVAMPLLVRRESHARAAGAAAEMLSRVGLGARLDHKPPELSGGERQRAAIARALVTRPACVLADEPTGNLDRRTAEHVLDLMLELNDATGTCLIVATHDAGLTASMDRVVVLEDASLVERPPPSQSGRERGHDPQGCGREDREDAPRSRAGGGGRHHGAEGAG